MQETWVPSLHRKDPLEEGMATHSSVPAWRIPWAEEPGGYSPGHLKESDMTERVHTHIYTHTHSSGIDSHNVRLHY